MVYHIADANEYLIITGGGVDDVKIVKKAWVMPWQKASFEDGWSSMELLTIRQYAKISISPFDFEISLQAMTIEKLQFSLPAVFTIGPDDHPKALRKYALLLTEGGQATTSHGRNHVQNIVKGIIEGETRVIVSGMTMEEIFKERQIFKTKIIENVQSELDQFGLKIYNANVKELQDTAGSEYFKFLSRKAHEGASNQAKVDVANARMIGEIGEAEKRGRARQEISKIDAQTAVLETQRKSEKATADAELTTTQTRLNMGINLAQIQAQREAEAKDAELQRTVETKRAEMELERMRAIDLVHAKIEKESAQEKADARYYADTRGADGTRYKNQQDAEAAYYRATKEAEAAFYAKKKEAEGIAEMAKAYGHMSEVLGGPQGLLQYMMLQNNTYEKLAKQNAVALKEMQPKITVWNTGAESSSSDSTAPIRNLFQSLPPLLDTINQQTGIAPPRWLAQMPDQGREVAPTGKGKSSQGLVNGDNNSR